MEGSQVNSSRLRVDKFSPEISAVNTITEQNLGLSIKESSKFVFIKATNSCARLSEFRIE